MRKEYYDETLWQNEEFELLFNKIRKTIDFMMTRSSNEI